MEGWVSASEGGYGVRLSIGVTPELIQEGLARELVHRIQNVRRSAGFNIEDRIVTFYQASEQVRNTMNSIRFEEYISGETLSDGLVEGPAPEGAYFETQELEGETLTLGVQRNS